MSMPLPETSLAGPSAFKGRPQWRVGAIITEDGTLRTSERRKMHTSSFQTGASPTVLIVLQVDTALIAASTNCWGGSASPDDRHEAGSVSARAFRDEPRFSQCEFALADWSSRSSTTSWIATPRKSVPRMASLGDPPTRDAILDRIVHNVHGIVLTGESLRKKRKSIASEKTS